MTPQQEYLFDLQGYVVLENVVEPSWLDAANRELDKIETMDPAQYPAPLFLGTPKTESELYITNILEAGPAFVSFMDIPAVLGVIERVTGAGYRLNHTYVIYRWGKGYTHLHMGGTPLKPNSQYRCENGQMFSPLTKAVFPLTDSGPEDGCFAVIPGSHKSNFPRPWGVHPDENPPLIPVDARPGDAIIFTEATTHGSTVNISGRSRRTIYYCYSINWMPDWANQGAFFSDGIQRLLNDQQMELVAQYDGSGHKRIEV